MILFLLIACPSPSPQPEPTETASGDFVWPDPLSTPEEPTLSPSDFARASSCENCHPNHYAEWQSSPHAWAMRDPLFQALVRVRQQDLEGTQDAFCVQCHSAIGTRGGEITPNFSFDTLSDITMEGVTCESCHKVSALVRPYNSGHQLDPQGPMHGGLEDPQSNSVHQSSYSPLFETAPFCAGCHDVSEVNGLDLERPYAEWQQTPAAAEGRPCQNCHMPTVREAAATNAQVRDRHQHGFVGVDLPLDSEIISEDERAALRADIEKLLASSASLSLAAPTSYQAGQQMDVQISVHNDIDAHSFPTGTTFLRQCWLEIIVQDDEGSILFSSGVLDENGDLKNRWSTLEPYGDPNLISFSSGFIDAVGQPTLFTHLAAEHNSNAIPALYTRTFTYFIPIPEGTTGPVSVSARLRFRQVGPFLLQALGLDAFKDNIETYDIDVINTSVSE